jgi:hypothetical protein
MCLFFSPSFCRRLVLASTACLSSLGPAIAAETVTFNYGILSDSISVDELTQFAKTGEMSSDLQFYLRAGRQNPERIRQALSQEVAINVTTLDRTLRNPVGDLFLDQVGQAIYSPTRAASRQALRSALILSASEDNKVSLIEVIQNYPTSDVQVEVKQVVQTYNQVDAIASRIRGVVGGV